MLHTVWTWTLRHSAAWALGQASHRPIAFLKMPRRVGAILALVAANMIWGTTFVATKPMLDRVPPLTLAMAASRSPCSSSCRCWPAPVGGPS